MKLIDARAASEILGIRLARLYELVRLRVVPHVRLGQRQIRFDPDKLDEWAKHGGNVEENNATRRKEGCNGEN